MPTKQFEAEHTHELNPELAKIRRFAQRDVNPEEIWCGALRSCNTRVDRSGERFTKAYLERFAATLPGKPLLIGHDTSKKAVGRIYDAAVFPDGDYFELKSWYFTRANHEIVPEIELGIQRECSVGFNAGIRRCDLDGKVWLPNRRGECKEHNPLSDYDGKTCTLTYCDSQVHKAEGMEMSLVWVGCQYDAYAVPKGLWTPSGTAADDFARRLFAMGWNGGDMPQENDMDHKEALAEVERLKGLTITSEREKALEAKLAEAEAKAALSADGEKYHAFIISDILRMADALDVANHDEEKRKRKQYEAILAAVRPAGAPALEAQREAIAVEFNARLSGGVGQAGDGNTGGSGGNGGRDSKGKCELLGRLAGGIL